MTMSDDLLFVCVAALTACMRATSAIAAGLVAMYFRRTKLCK